MNNNDLKEIALSWLSVHEKYGLSKEARAALNNDDIMIYANSNVIVFGNPFQFKIDIKASLLSEDAELNKTVRDFEKKYNVLVYLITSEKTKFGLIYDLYYVSSYPNDNDFMFEELKAGYPLAYCLNKSIEDFSEFGSVAVKYIDDCIVRVG